MPRRPGDIGGDGDKIEAKAGAARPAAPPQLLAVHFHTGTLAAAPLHPKLKSLLAFWTARRGTRAVPMRADMPVYELTPWAEHIAILEPGPATFRFRLGGAKLSARFGRETTGHTLDDLTPELRKTLSAFLDLATAKQAPVAAATLLRHEGRRALWSELMLPLAGGRTGPPVLLLGAYPIKPVPP
jgi:hypothetical protein